MIIPLLTITVKRLKLTPRSGYEIACFSNVGDTNTRNLIVFWHQMALPQTHRTVEQDEIRRVYGWGDSS
jgi:hypothetical protein